MHRFPMRFFTAQNIIINTPMRFELAVTLNRAILFAYRTIPYSHYCLLIQYRIHLALCVNIHSRRSARDIITASWFCVRPSIAEVRILGCDRIYLWKPRGVPIVGLISEHCARSNSIVPLLILCSKSFQSWFTPLICHCIGYSWEGAGAFFCAILFRSAPSQPLCPIYFFSFTNV